ncbi:hypothetical protein [Rubinisphaera margarita]|uniref:hypothetical protein n=1 Tax=Rubinisphaera margarita TaxID=2909586 RepID=UPI001EE8BA64|nr:hypothetical protein [Rubinisphaera margarita]MCG6154504.1 hypothetical protein [Rubinisphaera margarita]
MEILKQTFGQFRTLFMSMPTSQQMMLVGVTAAVLGGFGYLMWSGSGDGSYSPVSVGKTFTVAELIRAEETLLQQGKTDFKRRGQRLLVPADKVEEYNAILLASGTLPQNWAEEWEQQYTDIGPFANNKQMDTRKEIARAKLASQMLAALPDVDYANVVWDQEDKARWPAQPRTTATVSVRPKPGREIPSSLVHAIRVSISGMKANLKPEDVTVLDLGRGIAHQQSLDNDPYNDRVLQRIQQLKDMYRRDIMTAIDYIDSVRVAVNVDIDNIKTSVSREQLMQSQGSTLYSENVSVKDNSNQFATQREPGQNANGPMNLAAQQTPRQTQDSSTTRESILSAPSYKVVEQALIGALPENVRVSVVIPESYFRVVAMQSGELTAEATDEEIRAAAKKYEPDVVDAVKARVAKIIPIPQGGNIDDFIDVGSYVPTPVEEHVVTVPWTDTFTYMITQWGSAVALGVFALWAFWMLNKTVRSQQPVNIPEDDEPVAAIRTGDDESDDEELNPKNDTKRIDHLQSLVRKNPDMTAAIISNWIQEAK